MLYTAILNKHGHIMNVTLGRVHGNTKFTFQVEAERLIDAERIAREQRFEQWERMKASRALNLVPMERCQQEVVQTTVFPPKPGPVPRPPRCRCTLPVGEDGINCELCAKAKSTNFLRAEAAPAPGNPVREARLAEALDIQASWQRLPNVGAFSKWLNERIALLRAQR